jgi:regulator of replication initiation timing
MKYYNSHFSPSIEVLSRNEDHSLTAVTLLQGQGTVTKAEHEILVASEVVQAFVRDGYLDFPDCSVLGPMHDLTRSERIEREKVLFNADPEEVDVTGDLKELTALVGTQANELAEAKKFNADLVEQNKAAAATNAEMLKRLAKLEANAAAPAVKAEAPAAKVETPAQAPKVEPAVAPPPPPPPPAA